MVAELTALRDQIDEVDKALLSLLAKRLELVAEVGEVKSQYGLPIYVPEREAAMLASRREEAAALGVPPDLIEDVLRRVMRESYSSENDKGFKTLYPNLRPVVIVGGGGQMGRLFEKMLTLSATKVYSEKRGLGAGDGYRRRCRHGHCQRADSHHRETIAVPSRRCRRIAFWSTLLRLKQSRCRRCWRRIRGSVLACTRCLVRTAGSLAKQVVVYQDGRQPEAYHGSSSKFRSGGAPASHQRGGARSEHGLYSGVAPLCHLRLWAASGGRECAP